MTKAKYAEPTWRDAVFSVLSNATGALHYAEIAAEVSNQKIKSSVGANPAATVASTLSASLSETNSPFLRVGTGLYTIKDHSAVDGVNQEIENVDVKEESETGALKAFGMYWTRTSVIWTGKPKLMGRQQVGATEVNMAGQVGVYILHDRERVIYVGRATDTMYARLKARAG